MTLAAARTPALDTAPDLGSARRSGRDSADPGRSGHALPDGREAGGAPGALAWADAITAALLFAIDPVGLGGLVVRAHAGPVRDRYLAFLTALLPGAAPQRRLPGGIADARLIGGLDLTATLAAGRPVAERGLLAEADGGILIVPMAERLPTGTAARIVGVMDRGTVAVERDGLARVWPARFGVVALDESLPDEPGPPPALAERLAFRVDLSAVSLRDIGEDAVSTLHTAAAAASSGDLVDEARTALAAVALDAGSAEALSACAAAFGTGSIRADLLAARAARAAAALAGIDAVGETELETAVRLVILPRATRLPAAPEEAAPDEPPPAEAQEPSSTAESDDESESKPLADEIVEAVRAAIPAHLLADLQAQATAPRRARQEGRAGPAAKAAHRGRPAGSGPGDPRDGARLDLVATLRAAAPWQKLRAHEAALRQGMRGDLQSSLNSGGRPSGGHLPLRTQHSGSPGPVAGPRIIVHREDCRTLKFEHRTRTTTIFVVDASGSSALHRLAEAKGAVELLLADCYVRRDRVALIAFRGKSAQLVLPPTHSLTRARASMAGLPGGGGTPLASAIDAAAGLADQVRRQGDTALLVFLTDGQANVARDGAGGRAKAETDALDAARRLRLVDVPALVVDTAPRPGPRARAVADAMAGRYLALPQADAATLRRAVAAAG